MDPITEVMEKVIVVAGIVCNSKIISYNYVSVYIIYKQQINICKQSVIYKLEFERLNVPS
jgi:hypothetical protein